MIRLPRGRKRKYHFNRSNHQVACLAQKSSRLNKMKVNHMAKYSINVFPIGFKLCLKKRKDKQ